MWRLGMGEMINAWPKGLGRIMVITHTGRKSGLKHQTPVNYAMVDGELYCTAAFGEGSDWYHNVKAHPDVEIWLPDSWWEGVAEEVTEGERYAAYADAYNAKYQFRPEPHSRDDVTYAVRPLTAFGWLEKDYTGSATRWKF